MYGLRSMIGGVAFGLAAVGSANAQAMIDMSKVTCEQLLSASPTSVDVAIWLSGYYNGLQKNTVLNLNQFKQNAEAIVTECHDNPKKSVMDTVTAMMSRK